MIQVAELVLKTLEENKEPMRPGDIATKSGLTKDEVDKAIKLLKKEEKVDSPKKCFYQAVKK